MHGADVGPMGSGKTFRGASPQSRSGLVIAAPFAACVRSISAKCGAGQIPLQFAQMVVDASPQTRSGHDRTAPLLVQPRASPRTRSELQLLRVTDADNRNISANAERTS